MSLVNKIQLQLIGLLEQVLINLKQKAAMTPQTRLLVLAKSLLGKHLTLDESIPAMVGCAEAVSFVLRQFGFTIPNGGIAGTASLLAFLLQYSGVKEVSSPTPGCLLVAATGTGNGKNRGHTGVMGENGIIMSNNSETGKWDTQWNLTRWLANYDGYGGIKTRYFQPI